MKRISLYVLIYLAFIRSNVLGIDYELYEYFNRTDPVTQQLYQFKNYHPHPIGIITTSSGKPVEIREIGTLNTDAFSNQYHIDLITHANDERIPERFVHAKGAGAFGYFEVTNDVSKYTKADVFNGVGKRTPVVVRFSTSVQNLGGSDLSRELKGLAVKFYTNEGNLDILCLHSPIFFHRDPVDFPHFIRSIKRNPRTNLFDLSMRWDFITLKPETLFATLWLLSEYGIPNGYRKMDAFPVHTFVLNNKNGDKYFVRFNFRTEQGIENLSIQEAQAISARDPDYYNRDLYDAIENKNYPIWKLEMEVMTFDQIKNVDYDPFDVTRIWKKDTYDTVTIGRLVLDRNPDNFFSTVEQSAFNPGNLVPGIPGPIDNMFKTRRSSYRDTQVYRLGVNHNRIEVNKPLYWKVYDRDGVPPLRDNMKDAPNYYPNSFNGPIPNIDPSRPKVRLSVFEPLSVDLEPVSDFFNEYLKSDEQRERLINNTIPTLVPISASLQRRVLKLFKLIDDRFGNEVAAGLQLALQAPSPPPPRPIKPPK